MFYSESKRRRQSIVMLSSFLEFREICMQINFAVEDKTCITSQSKAEIFRFFYQRLGVTAFVIVCIALWQRFATVCVPSKIWVLRNMVTQISQLTDKSSHFSSNNADFPEILIHFASSLCRQGQLSYIDFQLKPEFIGCSIEFREISPGEISQVTPAKFRSWNMQSWQCLRSLASRVPKYL